MTVEERLTAALTAQLEHRRSLLAAGAQHVGWKLGVGEAERIGAGPVVGHLTSATRLDDGATYRAAGALHADAELAVEIGADGWIAGCGAALELVDLEAPPGDPDGIVAANIFHRAFALGRVRRGPPGDVRGRLVVNGEVRALGQAEEVFARLRSAAGLLEAVGERLRPGDRVITGSIVQVPVSPGDDVIADLGELGRVGLAIGPNALPRR